MIKISRTGVVDRIEHNDPENVRFPLVIVLRDTNTVELYADRDGLEEYVGTLQNLHQSHAKHVETQALLSIMGAIKDRISRHPMSEVSHHWLRALYPCGLVKYAEDNL